MCLSSDSLSLCVQALALNGAAYTAYNLASFCVLSRVSTTTHSVLNVFRRVVVIAVTAVYFEAHLSPTNMAGVAVAVAGVVGFAFSK